MPFKWEHGTNPYVHNYFSRLRLGPGTPPKLIVAQANQIMEEVGEGGTVELKGIQLSEHEIKEASSKLREPAHLAQELLLVHPYTRDDNKKLKTVQQSIRQAAVPSVEHPPLRLIRPEAIFWFTPCPGPEAAELPEWSALGLAGPEDPQDLELDIDYDS